MLKTITMKIREAVSNYRVARRELGLTVAGQFILRRYGRQSNNKPGFTALSAHQQARGQRILERGRARIRRRNKRKCWIEITDKGRDGISIFLARYGTGYPAELPYEEAVKLAKQLNEHGDSRQPIEIEVMLGFGRQTLRLDGKLIASAREQLNQIISRRQQAECDRLNMLHSLGASA